MANGDVIENSKSGMDRLGMVERKWDRIDERTHTTDKQVDKIWTKIDNIFSKLGRMEVRLALLIGGLWAISIVVNIVVVYISKN